MELKENYKLYESMRKVIISCAKPIIFPSRVFKKINKAKAKPWFTYDIDLLNNED